ncbi:TPA: hypothetical protein QDA91_004990 [Burkholderia vietnamiensis]|nr:hypothetical protein [Burkholderia vietnamiensis]
MKKMLAVVPVLLGTFHAAHAQTVEPSTQTFDEALNTANRPTAQGDCGAGGFDKKNIDAIKARYQTEIEAKRTSIQTAADDIRNDAPKDGSPTAALDISFTFRDETADIRFDSPVIVMRDQKMSMDLPETVMKTQSWSWDSPVVVMHRSCIQGPPDTVVGTGMCEGPFGIKYTCPTIEVRGGKEICLDTPNVENRRQEIKLDVPEVTMRRQDWVIGVPEIKMVQQHIVYTYPALVVDKISQKSDELAERSKALSERSQTEFASIQTRMRGEIQAVSARQINASFSCQTRSISKQIRTAYNDLKILQSSAQASLQSAVSQHASKEVTDTLSKSVKQLDDAKASLIRQYVAARRTVEQKRIEALNKIMDSPTETVAHD